MIEPNSIAAQQAGLPGKARELVRFETGTNEVSYLTQTPTGRQLVLPQLLVDILLLVDEGLSPEEIARALSKRMGVSLSPTAIRDVIDQKLTPNGLLQSREDPNSQVDSSPPPKVRSAWSRLEFVFRVPLVSEERIRPVVTRLVRLFDWYPIVFSMLLVLLAHVAFYSETASARRFSGGPTDLCFAYLIVFGSVFIHELGHAAASRRFDCEHGDIGFTLYLIFPALYADLSKSWRLPGRQRAVIDVGGIYFQLLAVVPLWFLHRLTGRPYYAMAIYAIDLMVVLALNPLFKFDGYWLLVDLSGLVNLQQRTFSLWKELLPWISRGRFPPTLASISGACRKTLLVAYGALLGVAFAAALAFLVLRVPWAMHRLADSVLGLPHAFRQGPEVAALAIVNLLGALFFWLFFYRMVVALISRLIGSPARARQNR